MPVDTIDIFDDRVREDPYYVTAKRRYSLENIIVSPGTYIRYYAGQTTEALIFNPPIIHFQNTGIAFVKSGWIWSGRTYDTPRPWDPNMEFRHPNPDSSRTNYYESPDASGFNAPWVAYILKQGDTPREDIPPNNVAPNRRPDIFVKIRGVTGFSKSGDMIGPFLYAGRASGEEGLYFYPHGTASADITFLMRALLSTAQRANITGVRNRATWTGAKSDYTEKTGPGPAALFDRFRLRPNGGAAGAMDAVVCNRFARTRDLDDNLQGRILPGSTEINMNRLIVAPPAVSVPVGGTRVTVNARLRYPPLYDTTTLAWDRTEQTDPGGDGQIKIEEAESEGTPARLYRIPVSEWSVDDNWSKGRYQVWDFTATDGSGTENYTRPFTLQLTPADSDVFENDSVIIQATSEEDGEPRIIVTARTVRVVHGETERSVRVYLSHSTTNPVTITATEGSTDLPWTHSPASFDFDMDNWNIPQTFTVSFGEPVTEPPDTPDGRVTYTFTAAPKNRGQSTPYDGQFVNVVFIVDPTLVDDFPEVGARVVKYPGGTVATAGVSDDQLIQGKYYIEELERDLIADTITATVKQANYTDTRIDDLADIPDASEVPAAPANIVTGLRESVADNTQFAHITRWRDPEDSSITSYQWRVRYNVYARPGDNPWFVSEWQDAAITARANGAPLSLATDGHYELYQEEVDILRVNAWTPALHIQIRAVSALGPGTSSPWVYTGGLDIPYVR